MKRALSILSLLLLTIVATANPIDFDKAFKESSRIEKQIKKTSFPKQTYLITDFGAQPDTPDNPCHDEINRAIVTCSLNGGGTVIVPKGTFHTGPITLKSNVNFHIEEGAVLKFSTDQSLYFPGVITRWEGLDCYNAHPLIYAYGETNIAITGKGTIDGQGSNDTWWPMCGAPRYGWKEGMVAQRNGGRDRLLMYGETSTPIYKRVMTPEDGMRPQLINLYSCNTVLIEDVTLLNSPFWVIHPLLCESLIVRGVKVYNRGPNGDGCDPESCKNVLIENCTFDTGDDCIAIKSGRNADGRKWNIPSENIIVRNCFMKNGHGGVVIGSEISGGYQQLVRGELPHGQPRPGPCHPHQDQHMPRWNHRECICTQHHRRSMPRSCTPHQPAIRKPREVQPRLHPYRPQRSPKKCDLRKKPTWCTHHRT